MWCIHYDHSILMEKMLTQYKTNRHYWCLKGHIWKNIDFLLWANYLTEIRIQSYYPRLIRTSKNMCPQCVQKMIGFLWYFLRFFNGTFFNVRRKCHEICCNCFHFTHSLGSAVLFSYFLDSFRIWTQFIFHCIRYKFHSYCCHWHSCYRDLQICLLNNVYLNLL